MADIHGAHPHGRPKTRTWSRALRVVLIVCALALALLPVPVTWFGLLPAYRMHGRFLLFYAPVVCLLLLGYLFYVRDSIARILFADILSPIGDADPYYGPTPRESLRKLIRRIRAAGLALLPAVLLGVSFYCVTGYAKRLNHSVDLVVAADSAVEAERGARGVTDSTAASRQKNRKGTSTQQLPRLSTRAVAGGDSLTQAEARADILRQTTIGNIPLFAELTALYIGIFASAMLGLVLMALKEYAKEAIGLTEQELVWSAWSSEQVGHEASVSRDS